MNESCGYSKIIEGRKEGPRQSQRLFSEAADIDLNLVLPRKFNIFSAVRLSVCEWADRGRGFPVLKELGLSTGYPLRTNQIALIFSKVLTLWDIHRPETALKRRTYFCSGAQRSS